MLHYSTSKIVLFLFPLLTISFFVACDSSSKEKQQQELLKKSKEVQSQVEGIKMANQKQEEELILIEEEKRDEYKEREKKELMKVLVNDMQGMWLYSDGSYEGVSCQLIIDGNKITRCGIGYAAEGEIKDFDFDRGIITFGDNKKLDFVYNEKNGDLSYILYFSRAENKPYCRVSKVNREDGTLALYEHKKATKKSQTNDINDISWLYGSWKLSTGGFKFYVYIRKDKLTFRELTNGIPQTLWDGKYTLYMNRIEVNGNPFLRVDLNRRKIYSLKGEPYIKQ